jgi:acetyl-CoA carboxylase biotin carboxylase subunit
LCLHAPGGPGIRRDSGVEAGFEVPIFYDSLVSKLIAWGESRDQAIARMLRALSEYEVRGIKTTIPFFQWVLATEEFVRGQFHTTYLDEVLERRRGEPFVRTPDTSEDIAILAVALRSWLRAKNDGGPRLGPTNPSAASGWRLAARRDALRPA